MIVNHLNALATEPRLKVLGKESFMPEGVDHFWHMGTATSGDGIYRYLSYYSQPGVGAVDVLKLDIATGKYVLIQQLASGQTNDTFGHTVRASYDGGCISVGAMHAASRGITHSGAIVHYVLNTETGLYEEIQRTFMPAGQDFPYGYYGVSLDLTSDGKTLFSSAFCAFNYGGNFKVYTRPTINDQFELVWDSGNLTNTNSYEGRCIAFNEKENILYTAAEKDTTPLSQYRYNPETHELTKMFTQNFNINSLFAIRMELSVSGDMLIGCWQHGTGNKALKLLRPKSDGSFEIDLDLFTAFNNTMLAPDASFDYDGGIILSELVAALPPGDYAGDKFVYKVELSTDVFGEVGSTASSYPALTDDELVIYNKVDEKPLISEQQLEFPVTAKGTIDYYGRVTYMSGDGNYLFVSALNAESVDTSAAIFRYKRTPDGWVEDWRVDARDGGVKFSSMCTNRDATILFSGGDVGKVMIWEWSGTDYVKIKELALSGIDRSVGMVISEDLRHLVVANFTHANGSTPNAGKVNHFKLNPDTWEIISPHNIAAQNVQVAQTHYGIGLDLKDGFLAIGRYDGKVEMFKLDPETELFKPRYSYSKTTVTGMPGLDSVATGWGYSVTFGADVNTLFVSASNNGAYKSALYALRADPDWTSASTAEIRGSYIPNSHVPKPEGTDYFGWRTIYDRITNQVYATAYSVTIDGADVGSIIYSVDDSTMFDAPTPVAMLRDPRSMATTQWLGYSKRFSADGNFLAVSDNHWINGTAVGSGAVFIYKKNIDGKFELLDVVTDKNKRVNAKFGIDMALSSDGKLLVVGYGNAATVINPDLFELRNGRYEFVETIVKSNTGWSAFGDGALTFYDHDRTLLIGEHGADNWGLDGGAWHIYYREPYEYPKYKWNAVRACPTQAAQLTFAFLGAASNSGKWAAALHQTEKNGRAYRAVVSIFKPHYDPANGTLILAPTQTITFKQELASDKYSDWSVGFVGDEYFYAGRYVKVNNAYYRGCDLYKLENGVFNLVDSIYAPWDDEISWASLVISEDGSSAAVNKGFNTENSSVLVFQLNPESGTIKGDDFSLSRVVNEFPLGTAAVPQIPVSL